MKPKRPSPNQRQFAQQLRSELTDCEHLLWQRLRNRQLAGKKFRRQYPCPPYVLDFYCAELRLAVELDGGQHYLKSGQLKDRQRDEYLAGLGIQVARFSNRDVLMNLDGVLAEILRLVDNPPPHPSPLLREERG